jgi:hypothetical protein
MAEQIKKKRGRKPKETTIINNNPVFANDKDSIDDLIIKLNYNEPKNNDMINANNDILYNINDITKNTSDICWNCCHAFDGIITGLPHKCNNNIFYTVGDFCSLECAARYAYDNYKDNIHEIINIINMYKNIKYNSNNKIKLALPRLTLKKFGGNLSIEEYRKNINNIYNITIPITIPVNMNIEKYEYNKNISSNLKLYRKNNNKENIFNKINSNMD